MAQRPDPIPPVSTARVAAGVFSDYLELTKPRVTTLVVSTTAFGFYLGSRGAVNPLLLAATL